MRSQRRTTNLYRSREQALIGATFGAVVVFVCLTGVGVASASSAPAVIAFGAVAVIVAIAIWRVVRCGVLVDDEGVVIRNPTRTARFAWHEIDHIAVVHHGAYPKIAEVRLRDGQAMRAWGIQGPNPDVRPRNRSAERLVDALNAELAQRR
jgi:Bacterial PH domain